MGDQDLTPEQIQMIMDKYKLSQEEHNEILDTIKRITFIEAEPTDNPIAIIIGGQAAAGKSSIISYSRKLFRDGNVVVIKSDSIKGFYPNIEEVAKTRLDSLLQTDGLPIWQTESEQIQLGKLQEELDNILCIGDRD